MSTFQMGNPMAEEMIRIVLRSGKDQSLKRFHPWVFSGAIKKIHGTPAEGALVKVYSNQDEFLGLGHYQTGSIAVRIVSFSETVPDYDFWKRRIRRAWDYRKAAGVARGGKTNVFRLIHAEGDGMPGLIVDFYNGTAVMQLFSVGMYLIRQELVRAFKEVLGDRLKA